MHFSRFTSIVVTLVSTLIYVNADAVITAPMSHSWKAGTKNIITWQDNGKGNPMPTKHDIALMQGEATSLALVGSISNNADASLGQYQWDIPATQAPAKNYAIRIGAAPNYVYSPQFEILASDSNSSQKPSSQTGGNNNDKKSSSSVNPIPTMATLSLIAYVTFQLF